MKNQQEIWKDIPNYEGLYQCSNLGRVKSLRFNKEKILKQGIGHCGYSQVVLSLNNEKRTIATHRLVANSFLNNPKKLSCVCHKNDNKTDSFVENLFWGSHKDNMMDKVKKNRQAKGENIGSSKLRSADVLIIKELLKSNLKQKEIAIRFNVSPVAISYIKHRKTWH